MIFEYRVYHIAPGQRAALNEHMEQRTLPVFREIGIKPIGFWEPEIGPLNKLHYIVPYADYDERNRLWNQWLTHPDRKPGIADDGTPFLERISNELWEPTDYSSAGGVPAGQPTVFEFHRHRLRREIESYHDAWRGALPLMHKQGIHTLGFWLTTVGTSQTLNYLLAFDDLTARKEQLAAYVADPDKRSGFASDGLPFTHVDFVELWRPTSYSDSGT